MEFIRLCVIHNSTEFINRIIFIKPKLSFLKVSSKKLLYVFEIIHYIIRWGFYPSQIVLNDIFLAVYG